MKFSYRAIPDLGSGPIPRPIVPVTLLAVEQPVPALVDSGALRNRFDAKIAEAAGLDISTGTVEEFAIGAHRCIGNVLTVDLAIGNTTWQSDVTFVQDWPYSHQILGLRGFFDQFKITFHSAGGYLTVHTRV